MDFFDPGKNSGSYKKRSRIFDITGISSNSFKNSKTACSSHLHPNDSANLYSNPGNVEKKSSHASYPFLDYPFLMHGKSMDQFTFGVPSVRHQYRMDMRRTDKKSILRIVRGTAKPSRFNFGKNKIDFILRKKTIFLTVSGAQF